MLNTPDWWPHNVESWLEIKEFFGDEPIYNESYWRTLPQGQSNYNYKLELPDKNYFVQSVSPSSLELLPEPECRVSQLTLAKLSQLKPYLVDCFRDNFHVKISQWFDAIDSIFINFSDQGLQTQLSCFLSQLHSLKVTINPENDGSKGTIEIDAGAYVKDHSDSIVTLPVLDMKAHLKKYYDNAFKKVPGRNNEIEALYRECIVLSKQFKPTHFCHNDLNKANILSGKEGESLKIIDWEYACISDPMFDLAGLINHCSLSDQQTHNFLNLYTKKMDTKFEEKHLDKMKKLNFKISKLWSLAG